MLSTPLIWFSRGAATVCSSVAAEAPGYTARTVTTGGAISGYCAIGSTRIAASPAMTMKIESTAAKIGRSIKKREIMVDPDFCRWGRGAGGVRLVRYGRLLLGGGGGFLRAVGGLLLRRRRRAFRVRHLDRRTGTDLENAVHDHAVAGLQAGVDDPAVSVPVTDLERPRLGLALGVDDVGELALRAFQHRALRQHDCPGPHRALQHDADELSRAQLSAGIRQLGARLAGAGLVVDPDVGEAHEAGTLVGAAVGEIDRGLEAPVRRQLQASGLDIVPDREAIAVGNAEVDVHRIGLGDGGEQDVRSGDECALGHHRAAGDAGDR